jgi:hypothetical protein
MADTTNFILCIPFHKLIAIPLPECLLACEIPEYLTKKRQFNSARQRR